MFINVDLLGRLYNPLFHMTSKGQQKLLQQFFFVIKSLYNVNLHFLHTVRDIS